jgi:hypothetical protein
MKYFGDLDGLGPCLKAIGSFHQQPQVDMSFKDLKELFSTMV